MKRGLVRLELARPDGGCVRVSEAEREGSTYAVLERLTSSGAPTNGVGMAAVELDRLVEVLAGIRSRALVAPVRGAEAARVQEAAGIRKGGWRGR